MEDWVNLILILVIAAAVVAAIVRAGLHFMFKCPRCGKSKLKPTGTEHRRITLGYEEYELQCQSCGYTLWRDDTPVG